MFFVGGLLYWNFIDNLLLNWGGYILLFGNAARV